MKFTVTYNDYFCDEFLVNGPRSLARKWIHEIKPFLGERGDVITGDTVKKIEGLKDTFRYRKGKYRLHYEIDFGNNIIHMLKFTDRKISYKKTTYDSILKRKNIEIEVIEEEGSVIYESEKLVNESNNDKRDTFEEKITKENLLKWRIPKKLHSLIINCKDENELLNLQNKIPEKDYENLIYYGKPPVSIIDRKNEKKRVISDEKIESVLNEEIPSSDLKKNLFVLDYNQNKIVERFNKVKKGTWLIKGPAGTGKSIVLMSCAQIITNALNSERTKGENWRVLYTGYTNSLIQSTKYYLGEERNIRIDTVWEICTEILKWYCKKNGEEYRGLGRYSKKKLQDIIAKCLIEVESNYNGYLKQAASIPKSDKTWFAANTDGFDTKDKEQKKGILSYSEFNKMFGGETHYFNTESLEFILRELMEVVWGNDLSLKEYLDKDSRAGVLNRDGLPLSKKSKEIIWYVGKAVDREIQKEKMELFDPRKFLKAKEIIDSNPDYPKKYQYIFFDEAQNVPPTAIKMLQSLTKDSNLVIAADESQNLYNSGFMDKFVPKDKNVITLKKQFRSTVEIERATKGILSNSDKIRLKNKRKNFISSLNTGDTPEFFIFDCKIPKTQAYKIANYVKNCMKESGMGLRNAVVIVPTSDSGKNLEKELNSSDIFQNLPEDKRAFFAKSKKLDPSYEGLLITNPYSIQGLEYEIVIVADFHKYGHIQKPPTISDSYGTFSPVSGDIINKLESFEEQRKMFYVSCTRAKSKLLVTSSAKASKVNNKGEIIKYSNGYFAQNPDDAVTSTYHEQFFEQVIDKKSWNFTIDKNLELESN